MSSPIVQPFDFNPISVEVKTGSYQIPVGKYAYVIPDCDQQNFTIDGNIVTENRTISANYSGNGGGDQPVFTVPNGKSALVTIFYRTNSSPTNPIFIGIKYKSSPDYIEKIASVSTNQPSISGSVQRVLSSGDQVYVTNIGRCAVSGHYVNNGDASGAGFWVKSQQLLNGNRYTVALYNEIS